MCEKEQEELSEDELFEHYRIVVDGGQAKLRIDRFLMDRLANVSRNRIQEAIKKGFIKVDNKEIKPNYRLNPHETITISLPNPPRDTELIPENIALDITYEDDTLLIVHKPAGMVVHPAYNNWTGTLVNALAYHFQNLPNMAGNDGRPGLVHRIDKETSGLLVIAKTEQAMQHLAAQFACHSIERTYYALVWGIVKQDQGVINAPLGRSQKDRRIVQVYNQEGEYGKHAVTHYQVLKRLRYVTLIKCNLETGRTHQIRAHMKYLGHPLFADKSYGGNQILKGTIFSNYKAFVQNCFKTMPRQALHAKSLGFIHPKTNQEVFFESELPHDFVEVLERWENYVKYH